VVARTLGLVMLAGGAAAVLMLVLLAGKPIPTKKGVTPMSSFIRRRSEDRSEGEPTAGVAPEASSRVEEAVTSYTLRSAATPSEDSGLAGEPGGSVNPPGLSSYDELGQTIANVLRTAQNEAAQLLAAARAQAQSVRYAAEMEAKEARARFDAEMAESRSESERIRAEANRYAEDRRTEADLEANETRNDAETEARKLREAGEAMRRSLEEKGLARRQELIEASSAMESRMREALTTCHEVAAKIEKLVGEEPPELEEVLLQEVQEVQEVREVEEQTA
jgi:flagellar biosynthesis GTPase FlhF